MSKRWVLIESGSTQEFIFQSNRQRFCVGASALVTDMKEWINKAIDSVPSGSGEVQTVIALSSSALLLVDSQEAGQHLIRSVSEEALRNAPGLDVWGYIETDDQLHASDNPMERLPIARESLARTRGFRTEPHLRFPLNPFMEVCSITGLPATTLGNVLGEENRPISALTKAAWTRAENAHQRWRRELGDMVLKDVDDDLGSDGWIAIIHIDTNDTGKAISRIGSVEQYTEFSTRLEQATLESFKLAVSAVGDAAQETGWIRPILLGGDDVTVICKASLAADLVHEYLTNLEKATRNIPGIDADYLTGCGGIAFVKPHYPFYDAHVLAHELARTAKDKRKELKALNRSAWDFHLLHDSVARPLSMIREPLNDAVGTPLFVSYHSDGESTSGVKENLQVPEVNEDSHVFEIRDQLLGDNPPVSRKSLHGLRDALVESNPDKRKSVISQLILRIEAVEESHAAEKFIDQNVRGLINGQGTSPLLAVLDLIDVSTPVGEGNNHE